MVNSKWMWVHDDDNHNTGQWICAKCFMPNKNITSIDKDTNPHIYNGTNYCPNCGSKMLSPENDWIKLTDGSNFPKVGENVIVTYIDDSSDNRNYYTDVGWWIGIDKIFIVDNDMNYNVTHWKKMPEPCKEK